MGAYHVIGMNSKTSVAFVRADQPFGKTWEEWTINWCEWCLRQPKDRNPSDDLTGEYCANDQANPYVWFLTGIFGKHTTPDGPCINRTCQIPSGMAIFFPIIAKVCSFAEYPNIDGESGLRSCAKSDIDNVRSLELSLDEGTERQFKLDTSSLAQYRVQSPVFNMDLPYNNLLGVSPGSTRTVCDGFWMLLKPLPRGEHDIHFSGELSSVNTLFEGEPNYHLMVS